MVRVATALLGASNGKPLVRQKMIGNLLLGEEVPVFVGKPDVTLRLIDIRRWEDSDNVLLRYEVRHKSM